MVPSISEIARRACLSRQTIYCFRRGDRGGFGLSAQIRISLVISRIEAEVPSGKQGRWKVEFGSRSARLIAWSPFAVSRTHGVR